MIIGQLTTEQIARRIGLRRRTAAVREPALYYTAEGFVRFGLCVEYGAPRCLTLWAQAWAMRAMQA